MICPWPRSFVFKIYTNSVKYKGINKFIANYLERMIIFMVNGIKIIINIENNALLKYWRPYLTKLLGAK